MAARVIDKDQRVYTLERPEHLPPLLLTGLRDFYLADHPHIKITLDPEEGEVLLQDSEANNVFYSITLFAGLKFPLEQGLFLYARYQLLRALVNRVDDDGIKQVIIKRHCDALTNEWINLSEQAVNETLVLLMRLPAPTFGLFRKLTPTQAPTLLQIELAEQLKKIGIAQIKSLAQVEQILASSMVTGKLTEKPRS